MPDFSSLTGATVSGSLAVGLVLLLRPPVRRCLGAGAAHWLWLLVLLRFLIPGLPDAPIAWMPDWPEPHASEATLTARSHVAAAQEKTLAAPLAQSGLPPPAARDSRPASARTWRALVWAGGCGVFLLVALAQCLLAGRLLRAARDISSHPRILRAWPDLCPRTVRIRESAALKTPALCGCWRPAILLPPGWIDELSPKELRCVLLHETGHLRRGDLLWRWLFLLARIVHWFNPLIWLADHVARHDAEMACDEWVLTRAGDLPARAYGHTLLKAIRLSTAPHPALPGHVAMAESSRRFRRRIRFLARIRPRGPAGMAASIGLVLALVWLVGPPASRALDPVVPPEASPAMEEITPPPSYPAAEFSDPDNSVIEIEAKFIEITDGNLDRLIRGEISDGLRLASVLSEKEFHRILEAISHQSGVELLSAPRVSTKSGHRAVIEIIREFRYPTSFQPDEDGRITPAEFITQNTGITIGVSATAGRDGWIDLTVEPSVVEFLGFINYLSGRRTTSEAGQDALNVLLATNSTTAQVLNQPVFDRRRFTTSVSLRPGQTVLLGGLSRTDQQQTASARTLYERITAPLFGKDAAAPGIRQIERRLYIFLTARPAPADDGPAGASAPSPPPVPAKTPAMVPGGLPYGTPVSGKPGFAISPHAPEAGYVDLRGFDPGTEVKCPYSGKMFLVP